MTIFKIAENDLVFLKVKKSSFQFLVKFHQSLASGVSHKNFPYSFVDLQRLTCYFSSANWLIKGRKNKKKFFKWFHSNGKNFWNSNLGGNRISKEIMSKFRNNSILDFSFVELEFIFSAEKSTFTMKIKLSVSKNSWAINVFFYIFSCLKYSMARVVFGQQINIFRERFKYVIILCWLVLK